MRIKTYFVECEYESKEINKKITIRRHFDRRKQAQKYYHYIVGGLFSNPIEWANLTEVKYDGSEKILEYMKFEVLS